jgi:ABC-type nitrate/sulfonate/bicarbonate transport system ATPase subunit
VAPVTEITIDIRKKTYPAAAGAQPHTAIEDLQISLSSGEFVCLVGPSGCGKTTLLNIVSGLDKAFQGEVRMLHGRKAAPSVGYVFQEPRLLPWRTVRENIELALPAGRDWTGVAWLLESLGLEPIEHKYPERLSLGMQRRVALARAFAIEPDLLLMDEPFVSLDAPAARRARRLLIEVWRQRPHTVLFVTHDLREAIALADRLLFLAPAPTSLIHQMRVPLGREQRADEQAVEAVRQTLLSDYPAIRHLL